MINPLKLISLFMLLLFAKQSWTQSITIGSKNHPESRLLGEIFAQTIEQNTDLKVNRQFGLGGTLICFEALSNGEIDLYPEYTGTVLTAILKEKYEGQSPLEIYNYIAKEVDQHHAFTAGPTLGFSNSYVIISQKNLQLNKISDLKNRDDLKLGFSNEFIKREDGFLGLNRFYQLHLSAPRGIDHGLAYKALEENQIDITDAYSTDGRLAAYNFQALKDDKSFFPDYSAFPLIKKSTLATYPKLKVAIDQLENLLDAEQMQALNYQYEIEKKSISDIAFHFLSGQGIVNKKSESKSLHPIISQTIEHIQLTFLATFLAIILAIPLAVLITGRKRIAAFILSITGIIQTIPSLALLGFMIPLFGIGFTPAIIALFLYALLPIVRNTYTGLNTTDPILIEAGKAMGMTNRQILLKVRLPLAMEMIMAGIRTALTINIGTATLAAFIGAGGLGESIITGITLNDNDLILRGAIPAAILALVADQGMALVEKAVRPKGIKND